MEKLVVEITDESKIGFIKELLGSFDFLKVKEEKDFNASEKKLVKKFAEAFAEVDGHLSGKKKLKPAREFLTEL